MATDSTCSPDSSAPEKENCCQTVNADVVSSLQNLHVSSTADSPSTARKNFISWDDFFMSAAYLIAKRSKDPVTQVGACIANNENKVVGMGYNGMPNGCHDSNFPWGKTGDVLHQKYMYVCHAEMNAVLNKNCADVKGCRIYVGLFPCNECAKIIIQSGIREVIFLSDKNAGLPENIASKTLFDAAGVKYRRHIPSSETVTIDFRTIKLDS